MSAPRYEGSASCVQRLTREIRRLSALLAPLDPAARAGSEAPPGAGESRSSGPRDEGAGPLDRIVALFALSPFERDLLVLSAGAECSISLASTMARIQGQKERRAPTLGLAMAALPDPDWTVLAPGAPLRRWHLVEVGAGAGEGLADAPIRIDERVLHELLGRPSLARELEGLIEPVPRGALELGSSGAIARRLGGIWRAEEDAHALPPLLTLIGPDRGLARRIAAAGAVELGLALLAIDAEALPSERRELHRFTRLCTREALLWGAAVLVERGCVEEDGARREASIGWLLENLAVPVVVSSPAQRAPVERPNFAFDVPGPTREEQRRLFRRALGDGLDDAIDEAVAQFQLGAGAIDQIGRKTRAACPEGAGAEAIRAELWSNCRSHTRTHIDHLAQRIEATSAWEDLVLPADQHRILREIAVHVRHRTTVYEDWGFGPEGARGLGISALFAGVSGTGKTMAAEVLAAELRLDLYRIDLSAVVSKYIGETQKNLRQIFDAAEAGGAILLFDEADALFGKRSEVKDSHDRYANIEVGYLLQRVEAYRGLAVLTTNLKDSMDTAFVRRIRFVVDFQFPDRESRERIWSRVVPARAAPEGLDFAALSRLDLSGGNIRNVALRAAFLAADRGQRIRMDHVIEAARAEYRKIGRAMPEGIVR